MNNKNNKNNKNKNSSERKYIVYYFMLDTFKKWKSMYDNTYIYVEVKEYMPWWLSLW